MLVIIIPTKASFHSDKLFKIYLQCVMLLQGGLKAVVWTDAIQSLFTLGSVIFVITLGVMNVGGFQQVFEINQKGGRIEFFK